MKTFDYVSAWKELAAPMFDSLPANVRELYWTVVAVCGGLSQGKNLDMPWPEDGGELRKKFDSIPAEILATASRVIYSFGHWRPGKDSGVEPSQDRIGGTWKFANYADQSLAGRIHETLSPHWPDGGNGISFRIHEGFIRARCSTRNNWTWTEIGLATKTTWERIQKVNRPIYPTTHGRSAEEKFVSEFHVYCQELAKVAKPAGRIAEFLDLARYMVEESEIASRLAKDETTKEQRIQVLRKRFLETLAELEKKRGHALTELNAKVWLVMEGLSTENVIYYSHTQTFAFGWSKVLSDVTKAELTEKLTDKFPWKWELTSPKY